MAVLTLSPFLWPVVVLTHDGQPHVRQRGPNRGMQSKCFRLYWLLWHISMIAVYVTTLSSQRFFVDLSNKSCDYVAQSVLVALTRLASLFFFAQLYVNSSFCEFEMPRMERSRFKGRRGRFEICASTCFGSHHPSSSTCDVDEPNSMLRITCETKQPRKVSHSLRDMKYDDLNSS